MIERSFILADDLLDIELALSLAADLSAHPAHSLESPGLLRPGLHVPLGSRLDEAERSLIEVTLDYCEGDKRRTAAVLGCSLKTLYNKLNSYARTHSNPPVQAGSVGSSPFAGSAL